MRLVRSIITRLIILAWLGGSLHLSAAEWIRPGITATQAMWGIKGGLCWAIHPGGFRAREPRGLIRLGYPVLAGDQYDLINFIAIEPVVKGRKAYSELEQSKLDKTRGKRIWAEGESTSVSNEIEQLTVTLRVERFDNGAEVRLLACQRSDQPDELQLTIYADTNSTPLEYCILTATMGNMARTRLLWLKDEVVNSLEIYREYKGKDFAAHKLYSLPQLQSTDTHGVFVAISTDEFDPSATRPPGKFWYYGGSKVTQYWRKPAGTYNWDLQLAVNGRYTYWSSRNPIPGGVAFENFEMRERFYNGQQFVFGITRKTPRELGFKEKPSQKN